MGIMDLGILEFFSGLFSLIFVTIFVITGLLIASKYFDKRKYTYLTIGIGWIGLVAGWIPDAINFILVFFAQTLSLEMYLIIAIALYPPASLLWLTGFTKLIGIKRRKEILIISLIICIISEILFFIFLFTDKKAFLGDYINLFTVDFEIYGILMLFVSLLVVISVSILFSFNALRSKEPEVKLRGKLLLIAIILIAFGAALDIIIGMFSETAGASGAIILSILVVIVRLILAISSVIFYCGFILPKSIKEIFLKEK